MQSYKFPQKFNTELLQKILYWAEKHEYFCYFNPNDHASLHGAFDHFIAVGRRDSLKSKEGSLNKLHEKMTQADDYWVGYFSYDLKNEIERLESQNSATIDAPHLEFFRPETLIFFREEDIEIRAEQHPEAVWKEIASQQKQMKATTQPVKISCSTSKAEYLQKCQRIKNDIVEGEYYEINYCIEFFAENCAIDPIEKYLLLNALSPMPFSGLGKFGDNYIICASPERFLKKDGAVLVSQPIKGTIRRGKDESEDYQLKTLLRNSQKEIAENMMIVDLVRNDLSKSSIPGTVKVEEFFGIYTFRQVHQMISTVTSVAKEGVSNTDIICNAFPMGSMTGAPKIRVMQAIEALENSSRGIYSGALGYFKPGGDFDFNVVIRSIIYNRKSARLSFHVGSAITYDADPENEYEECLLKARSMMKVIEGGTGE